jgi:hypothetical protein
LPRFSFFEPTWYQTLTATIGALWSSWTSTVRPLDRTNFSYGTSGIAGADWAIARLPANTAATNMTATAVRISFPSPRLS